MKNKLILTAASAALMLFASCQKSPVSSEENGYLTFGGFSLEVDEALVTRADNAGDNYSISILNSDEQTVLTKTYAEVKGNNNKISLPAGSYTLVARSLAVDVPVVSWENPIYGTAKEFSIEAGQVTEIGNLICTLLQCKVTVAYSDEFLAAITGDGTASVEVTAGYPLDYKLNANGTYDQSAGYFAVEEGSTMTVVFKGNVEGKTAKMTKTFTGIAAKQWRQIKFVQKKNEQGQATFDIVIQDLISDATLNNNINASEDKIGDDPDAPKGDGGIKLEFDYADGCDTQLTDLNNMVIVPTSERVMTIKLKATVPNGILKFNVDIESSSEAFKLALAAADAFNLDLINPKPAHDVIFKVVPFPHGPELSGETEVAFDLSAAQSAITAYPGTHTFVMTIVDNTFCSKTIPVTMIVE
ncbi:MAG: DUF4493 domain-containing protein [Bacteroidales bacterium]|nr:DUF4493 domain-containing protein [Bacteroidales bacterium]